MNIPGRGIDAYYEHKNGIAFSTIYSFIKRLFVEGITSLDTKTSSYSITAIQKL